jgi:O-antigen/teichoic acid export membrane protein
MLPKYLKKSLSYSVIIDIIISLLNLLSQICFARILGVTTIGQYASLVILFELTRIPLDFSFNLSVIQNKGDYRVLQASIILIMLQILFLSIVWSIVLGLTNLYFGLRSEVLVTAGCLILFTRIFDIISCISYAQLEIEMKYKTLSFIRLIATLFGFTVGLILAIKNFGVYSLLIRDIVVTFAMLTIVLIIVKPLLIPRIDFIDIKKVLKFSMGVWGMNLLEKISKRIDYIIVSAVLGTDALGVYFQIRAVIEGILGFLSKPVQTVIYSFYCKCSSIRKIWDNLIKYGIHVIIMLAVVTFLISLQFGEELIEIFLGDEWKIGSSLLPSLMIYIWGILWFENLKVMSMAKEIALIPIKSRLVQISAIIVFSLPLTTCFGLTGSGVASAISALFLSLTSLKLVDSAIREKILL